MCDAHRARSRPDPSRRQVLSAGAAVVAGMGALVLTEPPAATARPVRPPVDDLDVYVLVTDGMRPDELNPRQAPTLHRWAGEGTRFTTARARMVAETLPNHAAMMTGVTAERNGVPANEIWERGAADSRTLDRPSDLRYPTVLERVRREAGLPTASVLSKDYLYGLFDGRATVQWAPFPLLPVTDHSLDWFTVEALKQTVTDHGPRLSFVNLGDMDRFGHMDLSGTSVRLARNQAVANTDHKLWEFEQFLRSTGRWDRSVLICLADHGMDWSVPFNLVSAHGLLDSDPALRGRFGIAQNGGVDLFTHLAGPAERAADVDRLRSRLLTVPGIASVHEPAEFRLGDRAGDLLATCRPGWRFSDPTPLSNPIPGNHGHQATVDIPFFVGGGHRMVRRGATVDRPVSTMDVAPTIAALFGLGHSDMDGRPLAEAFRS